MTVLLVVLAAAAVLAVAVTLVLAFRRRAIAHERRRVATLTALAEHLSVVTATVDQPLGAAPEPPPRAPTPLPPSGSRGRTALLDALTEAVARARVNGSRLAVAVVASSSTTSAVLADEVHGVAGAETFEVGSRSVALVVPGVGRADALGLLARIQAACGATGDAVELAPGEDAVELLTRVLAGAGDRLTQELESK